MTQKTLNIVTAVAVVAVLGLIFIGNMQGDEPESVDATQSETPEPSEDKKDWVSGGQTPANWNELVSQKEVREKARAERMRQSMKTASSDPVPPPMDLLEFQKLHEKQMEAMEEQLERPNEDDQDQSVSREEIQAMKKEGRMAW